MAEDALHDLADDEFSPTFLRNATAYGAGPRLRGDLVVNNLTGHAFCTGKVFLKSDGTSWRPLVHIADIARAFLTVAEAPRELVHDEAFNVGATAENYRIRDVAEIVGEVVPDSEVTFSDNAFNDPRNYKVNCDKLASTLGYEAQWTVRAGVEQLYEQFVRYGMTMEQLEGPRFWRLQTVDQAIADGRLDDTLRWTEQAGAQAVFAEER